MTEQTKKIVLPPFLVRRLEAFRIVKGEETSYLVRDKVQGKTHDFDAWQFFILEVLPGCDSMEKLQTIFQDRFDRVITKKEVDELFALIADRKLFDEAAAQHPLLAPFTRRTYEVVEGGKAQVKSFTATVAAGGGAPVSAPAPAPAHAAPAASPAAAGGAKAKPKELPAGVQDALGLDWKTTENMIGLFDPRPLLRVAGPLLMNLRHIVYAVPLMLLAAFAVMYLHGDMLVSDLTTLHPQVNLIEHLIFVLLTVHVVTTATASVVADHYKVMVEKIGLTLTFGFMPRWVIKMTGADQLTRKQTMWLHGSTLIARMVMFSLGTLLWYNTRDTHTALPEVGLLFMFSCGVGLLIESGNPLVKANCYYLLSAYLNEPHLRARAYTALMNKIKGGVYKASDNNLLALYALLSTTYIVLITMVCAWMLAKYVLGDLALNGSGLIITAAFAGYMIWRNYSGLKKFGETYERQQQFDRWRTRTLQSDVEAGEVAIEKPNYWKRALLVCFVLLLFLPYPYEPGGSFTIFPVQKQEITTDDPGLIAEVYFDGGEFVKKGTVLARLQHDDYQSKLQVLNSQVDEQRHIVQNLKTLPKPEDVKLAEQQLQVTRAHEPFSRDKVKRLEKLYPEGAITLEELESARKEHEVDLTQIAEKEAELVKVKSGPTKEEIAAAESQLAALINERDGMVAKIDRTALRMPFDGNILTLHLKDRVHSYLEKGKPFAEVENTGQVTAQIQVVESDLQYVKMGAPVRARPISFFNDEFEGKVTMIDRNVTQKSFGNVVNVIATFENKDGRLKTGMAGQAKLDSLSMPVWQAFTLSIARFVRVQLWSWIP
jgi:putative peptide zinc metalloprotease protein